MAAGRSNKATIYLVSTTSFRLTGGKKKRIQTKRQSSQTNKAMGFLKAFKKKKDKSKASVDGGKAAKEVPKPQSPPAAKTTNAVPEENARPATGGGGDASDAPTIGSSAHNSAENLPQLAATSPNAGGIAVTGVGSAMEIANRAASGESAAAAPPPPPALPPRPASATAASPTPLISTTTNGPPKPTLRRSKSIVEFDKSEHKVLVPIETQLGKPIESVYDGVHDGPELGTGITGVVRKVTHKKTKHEYAVKNLDLGKIKTEAELQQLREEVSLFQFNIEFVLVCTYLPMPTGFLTALFLFHI